MSHVRAIVITSTFLRHQFVVNRIASRADVVGVWQERKSFEPMRFAASAADAAVIARHFEARDASEATFFAADDGLALTARAVRRVVDPGGCNAPAEISAMRVLDPEVVFVFGTGILGSAFIAAFEGRILNLHLGLSPYYRGAGTNFWPLVNREPEYVGATIHYLDAGIDTGPIIAHVRPDIRLEDGPHEIGNRTIVAAADAFVRCALAHAAGVVRPVPQQRTGRLYQRKDFNAAAVTQLYDNVASGMIPEYLRDRTARDARLELIRVPPLSAIRTR